MTPLFDYTLTRSDDSSIRIPSYGIDIPPAQYAVKLAPYGLKVVTWNQEGSIEGDQIAAGLADISAGAEVLATQSKTGLILTFVVGLVGVRQLFRWIKKK